MYVAVRIVLSVYVMTQPCPVIQAALRVTTAFHKSQAGEAHMRKYITLEEKRKMP